MPYGASEILMCELRKRRIEVAVTVCDGAGTVISSGPEIVQGIGARMNGLYRIIFDKRSSLIVNYIETQSQCKRIFSESCLKREDGV